MFVIGNTHGSPAQRRTRTDVAVAQMNPYENTIATATLLVQTLSLVIQLVTLTVALTGSLGNPQCDELPPGR